MQRLKTHRLTERPTVSQTQSPFQDTDSPRRPPFQSHTRSHHHGITADLLVFLSGCRLSSSILKNTENLRERERLRTEDPSERRLVEVLRSEESRETGTKSRERGRQGRSRGIEDLRERETED